MYVEYIRSLVDKYIRNKRYSTLGFVCIVTVTYVIHEAKVSQVQIKKLIKVTKVTKVTKRALYTSPFPPPSSPRLFPSLLLIKKRQYSVTVVIMSTPRSDSGSTVAYTPPASPSGSYYDLSDDDEQDYNTITHSSSGRSVKLLYSKSKVFFRISPTWHVGLHLLQELKN